MSNHTTAATRSDATRDGRFAFLLALLGLPGSTIAWELPAGGLWLGVPLAAAAIAIGPRAHSARRAGIAAGVLGAVELMFMAAWAAVG